MTFSLMQKKQPGPGQSLMAAETSDAATRSKPPGAQGYEAQAAELSPAVQRQNVGDGTEAGLENYEGLLGERAGGALYRGARGAVTPEEVGGYAHKIVDLALDYVADEVKALDEHDNVNIDPAAVDAVAGHFSKYVEKATAEWAKTSEVPGTLGRAVDDNPGAVTSLAVLAAVAAVAADMKVPELKKKLRINDELSASVGVSLGTFQHMAVERVRGQVDFTRGNLKINLGAEHSQDGGTSASVGLKFTW